MDEIGLLAAVVDSCHPVAMNDVKADEAQIFGDGWAETADDVNRRLGVGYRALLRLGGDEDSIGLAERHVVRWLEQKLGTRAESARWDGISSRRFDDRYSVLVTDRNDDHSQIRRRLYRLLDDSPAGLFQTSIFAVAAANSNTIVIEGALGGADSDDAIDAVGTPRVVKEILDEVHAFDGGIRLTGSPVFIRRDDLDEVIAAVQDPSRTASVIVGSSPARELDHEWARQLAALTRDSVGIAAVFSVAADAVDELELRLGPAHRVPRGTVRTFTPSVDLDDPADGLAHRFVGPSTLARSIQGGKVRGRLPRVHARGPRTRLIERGLPSDVRRAMDLLEREERRTRRADEVERRVSAVTRRDRDDSARPASTDEAAVPRRLVDRVRALLRRWLDRDSLADEDVDALDGFILETVEKTAVAEKYVDEVEEANAVLEIELNDLRERMRELEFDIALSADELRRSERNGAYLAKQLRALHHYDVEPPEEKSEWNAPDDVLELSARLTEGKEAHFALSRVVFTGDAASLAEVKKRDTFGKYARDLWDYVHVLHDYAELKEARAFEGNLHMYLTDESHDGHRCSPTRHAGRESDTVLNNDKWRSERMFPVPETVEPSGQVLMDAHFKPTHRDQFAPRLHYYDDTAKSGKIYIGYIGRHLTNTKS